MRLMKNKRSGTVAVFDQGIVDAGAWEEVTDTPTESETQTEQKQTVRGRPKQKSVDDVSVEALFKPAVAPE
jgi:hypothetical protein